MERAAPVALMACPFEAYAIALLLDQSEGFEEVARRGLGFDTGLALDHELEEAALGFNHAKAGGLLLKKWNMPASLIAAVQWHHNPYHSAHYKEPAVVHLADVIVHALGLGVRPDILVPAPARAGVTPYPLSAGTLDLVAEALAKRLEEAYATLHP